jgi:hypothetical protein
MRNKLLAVGALAWIGIASSSQADAPPAAQRSDITAASAAIDQFLAGQDQALLATATEQFKEAIQQTSLADVREKTVGKSPSPATQPDKVLVSCTRRIVGSDGKTYEIISTVADGKLAGFFVRLVK